MIVGLYLLALAFGVYFGGICLGEFVFTDHTFPALLHLSSVLWDNQVLSSVLWDNQVLYQ